MENFNGGVYRNHLWYIIIGVFVFSFFLFYFDSSTVFRSNTLVQSINDYVHSVLNFSPVSNSIVTSVNGNNPIVGLPVFDNGVKPVDQIGGAGENLFDRTKSEFDPCKDEYVYAHSLPSIFNSDLLKDCHALCSWMDMCLYMSNGGLGPKLDGKKGVFTKKGWFATDQFALEVIFHNRMKHYKCLTNNSSLASAIYVPFYAGLDVGRYLWHFNTSMRDSTSHELVKWLSTRPEWQAMGGRDHFTVAGRITWDFRRAGNEDSEWGNNFMLIPEVNNMTVLVLESPTWRSNEFAIPYPTYFHPSKDKEVTRWTKRMRKQKRKYLFCFAGAPRPKLVNSIRGHIIEECRGSKGKCKLLECDQGMDNCRSPFHVMKLFQDSVFCLQPPGDSYTRRSAFDSMLAGCIPVFFDPGSAYVQYVWHLPHNYTKYSVFIPADDVRNRKVKIESTLSRISRNDIKAMRKEVIKLIPKLIYSDPRGRMETIEDAFDVTVKAVIERVNKVRKEIKGG